MNDTPAPYRSDLVADVVRALVLYSLCETQAGHSTTIRVCAEGNAFSVGDNGRGHAIDRMVDGRPYLNLIYTHFEYPFGTAPGPAVQLQGIGTSFVNKMCSELIVSIRKPNSTHRLVFREGQFVDSTLAEVKNDETGTTVTGTLDPTLQEGRLCIPQLEQWLLGVLAATPALKLFFNGRELHAPRQSDA